MLTSRQKKLIELLQLSDNYVTGKDLAKKVNVSDRTIRSDIDKINKNFDEVYIRSHRRFGYKLNIDLLPSIENKIEQEIPQNANDRCQWLLKELISKSNGIHLVQLENEIFVSSYSLDNDLKKIREKLQNYPSLKIIRSENKIYLSGEEAEKRQLYKDLLTKETKGNFLNLNEISKLWSSFDLLKMKEILEEVCKINQYHIRDLSLPMIMIHAGVAVERINQGNFVLETNVAETIENNIEYTISYQFFKRIFNYSTQDMAQIQNEVKIFSLLLIGKNHSEFRSNNQLKEKTNKLIECLISEIDSYFGIDFSKDEDLRVGLELHLQSLIERQKNKVNIENIYLKDIKRKYPLVFEMAVHAGNVIEKYTSFFINENELAFLSLHLGAAYERSSQVSKYTVVLIIPLNQIFSDICIQKIENRFSKQIEVIEVVSFFEEKQIQTLNPDLIITTISLQHSLAIPTVMISIFFDFEDEKRVVQMIEKLDEKKMNEDFTFFLHQLIQPDLFFLESNKVFTDAVKVIDYMCEQLIAKNLADENYKDDVLKREKISATSFLQGFAIPHSINMTTKKSCLSIMILDRAINWGDFDVRLVILLGVRENDQHLLKNFFLWLSKIAQDSRKFEQLLKVKNSVEFINQITN